MRAGARHTTPSIAEPGYVEVQREFPSARLGSLAVLRALGVRRSERRNRSRAKMLAEATADALRTSGLNWRPAGSQLGKSIRPVRRASAEGGSARLFSMVS